MAEIRVLSEFIKDPQNNRYDVISTPDPDIPHLVKIGGESGKFIPNINVQAWDDECWLNVNHPDIVVDETEIISDEKISLSVDGKTHRYFLTERGLEYEIEFSKKPISNKIELSLAFPEGLQFFFQAADDLENPGDIRPDDIKNSYAVYWKKRNHRIGGQNYKAGKFCHIYRPKIIDSDSAAIWADIFIDEKAKKLIITLDQAWLDSAKYPIRLDPEFGYHTVPGTASLATSDRIHASAKDAPASSGTVNNIYIYSNTSGGAADDIKVGIYDDSSGPNSKIGSESQHDNIGEYSAQWKAFSCNIDVSNGIDYFLCFNRQGSYFSFYYDATAGTTNRYYDNDAAWADPWPSTFDNDSSAAYIYGFYAEYTAAGGTTYTVACADGIALDDVDKNTAQFAVFASDGLSLDDSPLNTAAFISAAGDSVSLNDLLAAVRAMSVMGTDSISLNDGSIISTLLATAAADGITVNDVSAALVALGAIAADAVALSDAASSIAVFLAACADGVALDDVSAGTLAGLLSAFAADGIGLNDAVVVLAAFVVSSSDGISLDDAVAGAIAGAIQAMAADAVSFDDSSAAQAAFVVSAADAITLGDATLKTFTIAVMAADGITVQDTVSVQIIIDAKAADSITTSDAASALAAFLAAAMDGVAVSDVSIGHIGQAIGILSITLTTQKGSVTISMKKPGISLDVDTPEVSLDGG